MTGDYENGGSIVAGTAGGGPGSGWSLGSRVRSVLAVASLVLAGGPAAAGDPAHARGEGLFGRYCARCHGAEAQGAANWHQRDAQGKFLPPPLNGTGHAWHHPRKLLVTTVQQGTADRGGGMPAFGEALEEADINRILDWLVSRWPAPIRERWLKSDDHAH